ncbi:MAG: EAL domain-containing protein [Thermoleophilia bacterium]|nr:EAL domain-containing protein [Thermoleophilia bacterium]
MLLSGLCLSILTMLWALVDRHRGPASGWAACVAASSTAVIGCNVFAASLPPAGKDLAWAGQWVAVAMLGPSFLFAVTAYAGHSFAGRTRLVSMLWIPPMLSALLGLTNAAHHLIWDPAEMTRFPAGTVPDMPQTPVAAMLYLLPAIYGVGSMVLLARAHLAAPRTYRVGLRLMATSLALGMLLGVPSSMNSGFEPWSTLIGHVGMVLSAAAILWCVRRYPLNVQRVGFSEATREVVVEMMSEGVVVVDPGGLVIDENPAAARLLDLPARIVGSYARDALPGWLMEAVEGATDVPASRSHAVRPDRTLDVTAVRAESPEPGAGDVIVVLRDGTSRAQAEARLADMALRDALTGLPNRASLDAEIARRVADTPHTAYMLMDLNGFKSVNDTHGHASGDDLLRETAGVLSSLDIPGGFVGRLGGDEFMVLAPYRDAAHARAIAEDLAAAFDRDLEAGGHRVRVSASVGLALGAEHGTDVMHCADVAMYQAKRSGLRVAQYDAMSDPNTPERLRHLSDLQAAIQRDELVLHYQPVYDLQKGRTAGAEALVRWQHPTLGLLPPSAFLGDLEELGLGRDLGLWVATRSLRDRGTWPVGPGGLQVAFNLTARELADARFVDRILALLVESGLPAGEVIIEVTEAAFISSSDDAAETRNVRRLLDAGARVVLDDFGTGHASVTTLRDLGGSVAKIAGTFVARMRERPDDLALVQGLTELARRLGYMVLAEWVEDAETLEMVHDMGIRFVQGFHIAPPMPTDEFAAWLCSTARPAAAPARVAGN